MKNIKTFAILFFVLILLGCATFPKQEESYQKSNLTSGTVKREIIKNQTTQADILKLFGAPNLVTMDSNGNEVWNYNKMSYSTTEGSDAGTLIFWGGSRAISTSTTKSFDLILTFDKNDVVKDYRLIAASF